MLFPSVKPELLRRVSAQNSVCKHTQDAMLDAEKWEGLKDWIERKRERTVKKKACTLKGTVHSFPIIFFPYIIQSHNF